MDLRRSHRASGDTCRDSRGTGRKAAARAAQRIRCGRRERDSVGVGPDAWRRCRVGPGERDGSRARPMGARQLTARVAVGGGRFPIGSSRGVAHLGEEYGTGPPRKARKDTESCMRERFFLR
jgi:hypothetical protein